MEQNVACNSFHDFFLLQLTKTNNFQKVRYQTHDDDEFMHPVKIQYQLAPRNAVIHTSITYFDNPAQYEE